MAETARDLVTNALLDLGVIADEEVPTASQAAGALRKLNNMIEAWNTEGLLVYGGVGQSFPLVANKSVYTYGPGGDFNSERPVTINDVLLRDTINKYDWPIAVLNQDEYAGIPFKSQTETYPQAVYVNDTYPLKTLTVWPIPLSASYSLVFFNDASISNFSLDDEINLAPGYKRALEANLVIELSSSYRMPVSAETAEIARDSKSKLKLNNASVNTLKLDPRLTRGGNFDIRTRSYR